MLFSKKYIEKFRIIKSAVKNFGDFLLYVGGLKSEVEVELISGEVILFSKEDRANLIDSIPLKRLKFFSLAYLLEKNGVLRKSSGGGGEEQRTYIIEKDGISIEIENPEEYDLFLEGLFYFGQRIRFEKFQGRELMVSFVAEDIPGRIRFISRLPEHSIFLYNLWEVFFERHYSCGNFSGSIVFDVGVGLGDSALFFLKRGAKKVIGFDLDRNAIELAKENMSINGVDENSFSFYAHEFSPSELSQYIGRYEDVGRINIVLKMDCEGCEFEIIPRMPRIFKKVVFEYHSNPIFIFIKLMKSGYIPRKITFFRPWLGTACFEKIL